MCSLQIKVSPLSTDSSVASLPDSWPRFPRRLDSFTLSWCLEFVTTIRLILFLFRVCSSEPIFVPSLFVRAIPSMIPNRKQKQSLLSGIFCRISFIPNHFNRNRNRNRFVPVTTESLTICDICDQNVTKLVLLKKLQKKTDKQIRSQIQICNSLQVCDRHKCHKFVTHSVWLVQPCFCFCLEFRLETALIFRQLIVLVASWPIVEFVIIQRLVDSEIMPWYLMLR